MTRRILLARKNLLQDRRRALLAVCGVAASLVLVLVLDGIFAGAMRQVNAYMRNSPADVFVAQKDVRTMHMTQSALPPETVDEVRAVDGVAWAEGLRSTTSIVESGGGRPDQLRVRLRHEHRPRRPPPPRRRPGAGTE
jgi:putative ABC transport system permease protein